MNGVTELPLEHAMAQWPCMTSGLENVRQSMGTRDQSLRCPLLLMGVILPPIQTLTATFLSGRWTRHSWEALACWTRHLSCAALRPTRYLQYSQHRLAPTTPSGWPASSGLPTGMLSLWPMTGRSTALWSNTAASCPGCLSVLYCLGRCRSVLTHMDCCLLPALLHAIQGPWPGLCHLRMLLGGRLHTGDLSI